MLDVMYEIPSLDRVREVVINEEAIMGVSRPLVLQDCAESA
jgi:ATP-dependent Clp protease ATP-binding subunit ClpX